MQTDCQLCYVRKVELISHFFIGKLGVSLENSWRCGNCLKEISIQ